mmetsp:Transcript_96096/g.244141  ORF Transcript_96096/g.244141 Transcript_96096/m.244141 type:complete len:111 (-) Transcript_96096:77-409(-)
MRWRSSLCYCKDEFATFAQVCVLVLEWASQHAVNGCCVDAVMLSESDRLCPILIVQSSWLAAKARFCLQALEMQVVFFTARRTTLQLATIFRWLLAWIEHRWHADRAKRS